MASNIVQIQMPIHLGRRTKQYEALATAVRKWCAEYFPGTEDQVETHLDRVNLVTTAFDPVAGFNPATTPIGSVNIHYFRVFVILPDPEQAAWFALTFSHPDCLGIETNIQENVLHEDQITLP